ncbi:TetR/AcrR family transcriptional regulator [Peribacillus sp. SI8-4]|uniref:TetR/AcrR family transcriptional regulator n=1 Tax=Peribacillus sp. SI8-4 TaxID=3048009 RepID=UPI00255565A3|nr:TetR/AcrR family transcriptional regulator [Peribacillus sp. SI8-4]
MAHAKTDPRVQRTRKLIMDSFIELSGKKEFKDITVKDITTEAMINRATFYYHFQDIYDLLERVLSEVFLINLNSDIFEKNELNGEAVTSIFIAITNFQKSLSNRCHRGYGEIIARIIREQLEIIFYKMLLNRHSTDGNQTLMVTASMLSWGIYGASVEWNRNGKEVPPAEFIKLIIPTILYGIELQPGK